MKKLMLIVLVLSCSTQTKKLAYLESSAMWHQSSAEFRAISYQTFHWAQRLLKEDFSKRGSHKSAIIVDIDETILDNGPFQTKAILKDEGYPTGWSQWVDEASAKALPGAIPFLKSAEKLGYKILYVSNRKIAGLKATVKNLKNLGLKVKEEDFYLRDKSSSKEDRRRILQGKYRISLAIGDNLNDFSFVFEKKSVANRKLWVDRLKDKFGTQFIVLPNPMYGEWEGAIYNYNWGASPREKMRLRRQTLTKGMQ